MQMKKILPTDTHLQMDDWKNNRNHTDIYDASEKLKIELDQEHPTGLLENVLDIFESIGNGLENQFKSPMERDLHN